MSSLKHIFLDDGDVMNDNAIRGPEWRRLIGEFFAPRLGGTREAWAAANAATVDDVDARYWAALNAGQPTDEAWRERVRDRMAALDGEDRGRVPSG